MKRRRPCEQVGEREEPDVEMKRRRLCEQVEEREEPDVAMKRRPPSEQVEELRVSLSEMTFCGLLKVGFSQK